MCFVCGKDNPEGLKLDFDHSHKGLLKTTVTFRKNHQGYRNIVHGGLLAAVLDEIMVNLAWKEGMPAVTADLQVRLKKAARIGQKVHLEGRVDKVVANRRLLYASSKAADSEGRILATATATCLLLKEPVSNES